MDLYQTVPVRYTRHTVQLADRYCTIRYETNKCLVLGSVLYELFDKNYTSTVPYGIFGALLKQPLKELKYKDSRLL
jgi:hypothetical protein